VDLSLALVGVCVTDGTVVRAGPLVVPVGDTSVGTGKAVPSSSVDFGPLAFNKGASSAIATIPINATLARRCTSSPQLCRM
jgi:hypothetical protein